MSTKKYNDIILKQLLEIRDSGETNMLDTISVKEQAGLRGFDTLRVWIDTIGKDHETYMSTLMDMASMADLL